MSTQTNQQFRLASRPVGLPTPGNWQLAEEPLAPLAEGEVRVKIIYLSLDPAMRGWMNEGKSYIAPVELGAVMRGFTISEIVESRSTRFTVGQIVQGSLGWQRFAVAHERYVQPVPPGVPLPAALSA